MIEHFFTCPYCWTEISILIDPPIPEQRYIEDCENCCHPFEVEIHISENELNHFKVRRVLD